MGNTCEDEFCTYYRDGFCGKESVHHSVHTSSEFRSGERVRCTVCDDRKELEDDGAD